MTDPLGQSQVLPYLEGLSQKGYSISLISFEKPNRFQKNKSNIQVICDRAQINWYPQPYTKTPPVLSTVRDIRKMQRLALDLHKQNSFQLVHCRSYLAALVGRVLQKKHGVKFLFDMRGFWADERIEGNIWNPKNLLYKGIYTYFKRQEKEFFSHADYTVSLTEAGKKEIHTWGLPNQPIPIEVIPCCADLDLFSYDSIDATQKQQKWEELGLPEEAFVLSYLGSIGTWYMLEEMVDFFNVFLEEYPQAYFVFITKESPARIHQTITSKGIPLDHIRITEASRQEVPYYLSISHANIFFIKPIFSKTASSPTKQGEVMGMGIPIICNDYVGDTGSIIRETGSGRVITSFNRASYQQVLQEFEQLIQIPKTKIREGALRYYSLKMGVEKYSDIYNTLLS